MEELASLHIIRLHSVPVSGNLKEAQPLEKYTVRQMQLHRRMKLLDWEGNRNLLPVRTTKEYDLDREQENRALKLRPDVKGSDMRQPNGNWTDVDTDYDAALENWTLDLELSVE